MVRERNPTAATNVTICPMVAVAGGRFGKYGQLGIMEYPKRERKYSESRRREK